MTRSRINPYVRFASVLTTSQRKFKTTRNYDCRIFFMINAVGSIEYGGSEYKLSPNDIVYFPPASRYRLTITNDNAKLYLLGFDLTVENSHTKVFFTSVQEDEFDEKRVISCELPTELQKPMVCHAPALRDKLGICCSELAHRGMCSDEIVSGQLKVCLGELIRQSLVSDGESRITGAAISHIMNNYSDPSLDNDTIAELLGYHPYYLSRVIKAATGKTLHRYIVDYRIQIAKNHLTTSDTDISVIAKNCGFTSPSYFAKVFRDEVGETPGEYRRKYTTIV